MGVDKKMLKEQSMSNGDLTSFMLNNFKKSKNLFDYSLTLTKVYESKEKVLNTIGQYSQNERIVTLTELYDNCYDKLEAYYITKIFLNKMKLGFGQKTVVSTINQMKGLIDDADYGNLFKVLEGIFQHNLILNKDNISPGNLVELMLCKSEGSLDSLLETLKKSKFDFLAETKYDGERTQVCYYFIYK
jgi:ATP-dependent DNA ligase